MNPSATFKSFHANAKLMITGEYLVLRGAKALAIPLCYGQSLTVSERSGVPSIDWKTIINGNHWFDAIFSPNELVIGNSNDFPTAQNLREIFFAAKRLNPQFLSEPVRYDVVSRLDFDINWGLGSSSSLIANIAKWAEVDPFQLFFQVSAGSGYDLAAALSDKPIIYSVKDKIHEIQVVDFFPAFHNHLWFAYLGKKKNSAQTVSLFNNDHVSDFQNEIIDLDVITEEILKANKLSDFQKLIMEHEKIISGVVKIPPVGERLFSDFNGVVKSLGAWGGDFVLLATDMHREYVASWLRKKDLSVWFAFEDIILR